MQLTREISRLPGRPRYVEGNFYLMKINLWYSEGNVGNGSYQDS